MIGKKYSLRRTYSDVKAHLVWIQWNAVLNRMKFKAANSHKTFNTFDL